jgi:hypothetical protein
MAMLRRLHPIAGVVGFVTILIFWTSTAASEMFGSVETITAVKRAIPWGLLILVPALAIAGATGFKIAGASTDPRILKKKHRMPFIAGNGLLILVPAALYLAALASNGEFGNVFYGVQTIELVAGALNLMLMGLNIRDGLRLTGQFARR